MRGLVWFVTGTLISSVAEAERGPDGLEVRLAEMVQAFADVGVFEGEVLVTVGGEIVYRGASGFADRGRGERLSPGLVYPIGSLTKQFTAAACLRLAAQGRIDLDTPIETYFDELEGRALGSATTHNLLTHTAGLPMQVREISNRPDTGSFASEELLEIIRHADLLFAPGSEHRYSSCGYVLAAILIERITDMTFADAMRELLFDPCGMYDTIMATGPVSDGRVPRPQRLLDTGEVVGAGTISVSYALGSGCIATTVTDLHRWDVYLADDGFIAPALRDRMFTPFDPEMTDYGYGWRISEYERGGNAHTRIRHGGSLPGYASNMHRYVDEEITVIVLSNLRGAPVVTICDELAAVAAGETPRPPRTPATVLLYRDIQEDGVASVAARYAEGVRSGHERVPSYQDLHRMGHQLRRLARFEDAIAVFEVNLAGHPDRWHAHENLGRVYHEMGDLTSAEAQFRLAVSKVVTENDATRARSYLTSIRQTEE